MLKRSKTQKMWVSAFILGVILAAIMTFPPFSRLHSPAAFIYMGLVLAWTLTVRGRLLQDGIKNLLTVCSVFMVLIFVFRICRYDFFRELPRVSEYMLYFYGICYSMAAMLSFFAALRVGKRESDPPPRLLPIILCIAAAILCALMLTNPRHRLFYVFEPGSLEVQVHGPVYYAMVIWCAVFAVAAIVLLLVRCRNSVSRRYWFYPAAGFAAGAGLLAWYFVVGGAPKIGGYKLFNIQEAFCLAVILPFEAMFRIGLIPTNSDYGLLFRRSDIRTAILDADGETVMSSLSYSDVPGEGERVQRKSIHGGSVTWTEDISELLRLQDELTEVNEALDSENELIREEKSIREERISLETRSRIYDRIREVTRHQAASMRRQLEACALNPESGEPDPEDFRKRLGFVLVMGAYIKRTGNLMLLGDGRKTLPVGELALSVSESLEYLRLAGVAVGLECREGADMETPRVLLCYRVFEHFTEANYGEIHACMVELLPETGTLMRMALDPAGLKGENAPEMLSAVKNQGLELNVALEDDTWYISVLVARGRRPRHD